MLICLLHSFTCKLALHLMCQVLKGYKYYNNDSYYYCYHRDDVINVKSFWCLLMVNFMYQLDSAIGCPDIWSNIILGMSMRMFLDEINI